LSETFELNARQIESDTKVKSYVNETSKFRKSKIIDFRPEEANAKFGYAFATT